MSGPPGARSLHDDLSRRALDPHADDEVLRSLRAVATQIEREDVPHPTWVPASEWVAELRADAGSRTVPLARAGPWRKPFGRRPLLRQQDR